MINAESLALGLERVFEHILIERMCDVPVINPALKVQAVGFASWGDNCLGVLVTPWFMNLVLVPCEGGDWQQLSVGDKVTHGFPSGAYEFIVGNEEGIGRYQACSLFSPMFQFEDQATAVATAESVLEELMDEENRDRTSMREKEIEAIWRGDAEPPTETDEPDEDRESLGERLEKPISRRALLNGSFLGEL